jgi:hypothetical protein
MKETTCPGCKGDRVVRGRYFNPKAVQKQQARAPRFKPDGLKKFTLFDPSVAIRGREKFHACLDCGFLWSRVEPRKLTKSIQKNGTEATVQSTGSTSKEEASS